jgi:hypothetical protein
MVTIERNYAEESARILEGSAIQPTVEHVLELRNALAEAYRLLHYVRYYGELSADDRICLMAWQRRVQPVLDARVR